MIDTKRNAEILAEIDASGPTQEEYAKARNLIVTIAPGDSWTHKIACLLADHASEARERSSRLLKTLRDAVESGDPSDTHMTVLKALREHDNTGGQG